MSTLKVRGHTGSDSVSEGPSTMAGGCHVGSASTKSPGDAWRREKVQSHLLTSEKKYTASLDQLHHGDFSRASRITFPEWKPPVLMSSVVEAGCVSEDAESWPH